MNWPTVALGEVLTYRKGFIQLDDHQHYVLCRVQWYGQGVIERGRAKGFEIKTKTQQVCKAGDFIVAEIDAKEGGFGIVPPELEGAIVSSHYFLFEIDRAQLEPAFLGYYVRLPAFREQVAARGSTNYSAVRPNHVLSYAIPLPPLTEQRRIVAKIERLAGKIEEARGLREQVERDAQRLLVSMYHEIIDGAPNEPLQEVAPLNRRPVVVEPDGVYPQVSARSFGKGTFHNPPVKGSDLTWQKPYWVKANDILISNIKAWEGAIAVAKPEDDGRVASHRYLTCVPIVGKATARFVSFHLLTPDGLSLIRDASPGTADRNRTLNTKLLQKIPVPVPPYRQQLEFDRLCMHVEKLKSIQSQSTAELDALLPAILDRAFRGAL